LETNSEQFGEAKFSKKAISERNLCVNLSQCTLSLLGKANMGG